MKTPVVIGVVVALHGIALGTLLLTQGCGTPRGGAKPVVFQDKPAVLPAASTQDLMPKDVAKPRTKPFVKVDAADSRDAALRPESAASKSYTIKKGDSLGYIAQRFKISISEIRELNPAIKDPSKIREGQVLKVPAYVDLNAPAPKRPSRPKPALKPVDTAAPVAAAVSALAGGDYVVVSGDYPGKIAQKFGVKTDDLMKANKITDATKLRVGQKLVIPGAPAAPALPAGVPLVPVEASPIAPVSPLDAAVPAPAPVAPALPGGILEPAGELKPIVPAVAPAPLPPAPAAPAGLKNTTLQKHIVAPGETLKDIAMLYTVTVAELMKANGLTGETVTLGQSLNIPAQ